MTWTLARQPASHQCLERHRHQRQRLPGHGARNVSYNATIAPQAQTSFGFQGTYSGVNSAPSGFALNGTACVMG